METWQSVFALPVIATVDQVYDGESKRTLSIMADIFCEGTASISEDLSNVTVSVPKINKSIRIY